MRRWMFSILIFTLALAGFSIPSTQSHAQTGTTAVLPIATVINANALNIRTAPTTAAGVVAVAPGGASFSVLGRTADNGWWQLALPPSGLTGWASGWFLSIPNQHLVPVVAAPGATPATTPTGVVNTNQLNVRAIPDPYTGAIITRISFSETYIIIGRNSSSTRWYQITLPGGGSGWVNAKYLFDANTQNVPVTYNDPSPCIGCQNVTGTVTAYFLNVRSTPNPYIANILTVIARGQTYSVIGRNAAGTWWQIMLPQGITGWVNGTYFAVVNGWGLPITG